MQTTLNRARMIIALLLGSIFVTVSMSHVNFDELNLFETQRVVDAMVQIGVSRNVESGILTVGGGVIVSKDGYVLTAKHNLTNAQHLFVKTSTGDVFPVVYYLADAHRDLAVLKFDAENSNLSVARVGNSRVLHVGQTVVAIGYPSPDTMLDDSPSVSRGVVSALNRSIAGVGAANEQSDESELSNWIVKYADVSSSSSSTQIPLTALIQTDATVNSGSSGGPLIIENGSIVGIVQSMISNTGSNIGLNFAIPISDATLLLRAIGIEEIE